MPVPKRTRAMSTTTTTTPSLEVEKNPSTQKKIRLFFWYTVLPRFVMLAVLFGYLAFGGYLFYTLERMVGEENSVCTNRRLVAKKLWEKSRVMTDEEWVHFAQQMILKQELVAIDSKEDPERTTRPHWTYLQSVFFCWTIVTTIGYGDIYPMTQFGRIFTIVYGIVGIPLILLILADFGGLLRKLFQKITLCIKKVTRKIKRRFSKKKDPSKEEMVIGTGDEEVLVTHTLLFLVLYVFIGCIGFYRIESWDVLDCVYFIFVSLTTIGFGDITPHHPKFMVLIIFYLLFGLVIMAMCLGTIQMKMFHTARSAVKVQYMRLIRKWCICKCGKKSPETERSDDAVAELPDNLTIENERSNKPKENEV